MQNALKFNEWPIIGCLKLLRLKYRRRDKINEPFWRIGSPQKIRFPLFNLWKFQDSNKITRE